MMFINQIKIKIRSDNWVSGALAKVKSKEEVGEEVRRRSKRKN